MVKGAWEAELHFYNSSPPTTNSVFSCNWGSQSQFNIYFYLQKYNSFDFQGSFCFFILFFPQGSFCFCIQFSYNNNILHITKILQFITIIFLIQSCSFCLSLSSFFPRLRTFAFFDVKSYDLTDLQSYLLSYHKILCWYET